MNKRASLAVFIAESEIRIADFNHREECPDICTYLINNWLSAEEIIAQWASSIRDASKKFGINPLYLEIAMPGPFDYVTGISYISDNKKLNALYHQNIKQMLMRELEMEEEQLLFFNDAVCSLEAELSDHQLYGLNKVLGVFIDEGLGGACYQNGQISDAELWNKPFMESRSEDLFSLQWFKKNYLKKTGWNFLAPEDMSNVAQTSQAGKEIFREFTGNLSRYLASLKDKHQPEALVLGGEAIARMGEVRRYLKRKLSFLQVPIYISRAPEKASLVGAHLLGVKNKIPYNEIC